MTKYVEIGYPIMDQMNVYPGLPIPKIKQNENLEFGDDWNGSVLEIYLHAGTHCDAPWHYLGGNAPKMDDIENLPTESFIYESPLVIDCFFNERNGLITIDMIKKYGEEVYKSDFLIFNTNTWMKREKDFIGYSTGFPAVSSEAAEWIRKELPNVKAVAIDTLSIENIAMGKENGFKTHKAFFNIKENGRPLIIYEDINLNL
ncbi:Metal-dependent hydrolase [Lachnospiraceae bacterium TWA4]|nr:Metal-dependent hydrolase [Lachnospiraceae bacterium TWA4]